MAAKPKQERLRTPPDSHKSFFKNFIKGNFNNVDKGLERASSSITPQVLMTTNTM